jgi:hypothetical protein
MHGTMNIKSHSGGAAADTSLLGRVDVRVVTSFLNGNMVKAADCSTLKIMELSQLSRLVSS